MTLALFAAFWAVSILLVITPGMDWAYVISAGIRGRVVVPGAYLAGSGLPLVDRLQHAAAPAGARRR